MISRYQRFIETNLNVKELDKTVNGEVRGNVLIKKLKEHEPLTLNNGEEVTINKMKSDNSWEEVEDVIDDITTNGDYDKIKAKLYFTKGKSDNAPYKQVLKDEEGEEYRLNQLKKTVEFGSSGAGRLTRQVETIQSIFLAIKQSNPDIDLTPDNIEELYKEYTDNERNQKTLFSSEKVDSNSINNFINDKNWVSTFCKISNELWNNDPHIKKDNKYGIFQLGYKGNSPTLTLQNKYKEIAKAGGYSDINFAKWCPADVFLINLANIRKIQNEIAKCSTIDELTQLCDVMFDESDFIPISLKKINNKNKLLIITNKEKDKELPNFYIRKFMIGSDLKGIGSKIKTSSIWRYRDRKDAASKRRNINFDSSDTGKNVNVDGEVEGSSSRHGKISFRSIKRIIDSYREHVPDMIELQEHAELSKYPNDFLEAMIKDLISEISQNQKYVEVVPLRNARDIKGNVNKLISRLQSLQIIMAMIEMKNVNVHMANECVTKMMRYALSIQTDKFDTPRYLRVL